MANKFYNLKHIVIICLTLMKIFNWGSTQQWNPKYRCPTNIAFETSYRVIRSHCIQSKIAEWFSLKHLFHLSQHFLNKYVDDAITGRHTHRMSTTEDDNPPSPMDSIDIFSLSSQPPSTGSPASRQRGETGLRFPMTPPSNPHTPASPSAARMSGVSVFSLRHFLVCVLKMCKKSKSVSYLYRSMME